MILFPVSNGCQVTSFFALYVGLNAKKAQKHAPNGVRNYETDT